MKNQFILASGSIVAAVILSACSEKKLDPVVAETYGRPGAVVKSHGDIVGRYIFTGDVRITGDIKDGAFITVVDGGIYIEGKLGNNVKIHQVRTGKDYKNYREEPGYGLKGIAILGDAGKSLVVNTVEDFEIGNVGENLFAEVGGSARVKNVGDYGQIIAGKNIKAGNLGFKTSVNAKNNISINHAGREASIIAGEAVEVRGEASRFSQISEGTKPAAGVTISR